MKVKQAVIGSRVRTLVDPQFVSAMVEAAASEKHSTYLESESHYRARLAEQIYQGIDQFVEAIQYAYQLLEQEGVCLGQACVESITTITYEEDRYAQEELERGVTLQQWLQIGDELLLRAYEIGVALFERGAYIESSQVILLLTQLNPKVAVFWSALAICQEKSAKWREAAWCWILSAEMSEESLEPYFHAVRSLGHLGESEQAIAVLRRALERIEESDCFRDQKGRVDQLLATL